MAVGLIFPAFFRALGQMGDRAFLGVVGLGIALALGVLWAMSMGLVYGLAWLASIANLTLPFIGAIEPPASVLGWGSFVLMLGLSVFLMVPVASAISSLFLDRVARAVERRHYAHLPDAAGLPLADALRDTVAFLGVLIGANLLAWILYLFFAPVAIFIFWALNGYLLGREYFQMAAARRVGRNGARDLWRANRVTIWLAGILMVAPLSIPIVNLIVPVLGAATFTHLFHSLASRGAIRL